LISSRAPAEHIFLNRSGQPTTRFGIHTLVERHAARASSKEPSLAARKISPHTIRHTTATHLLRAGVDINTIRAWLGHVSLNTTNVYAAVDLEMKARALAKCDVKAAKVRRNGGTIPASSSSYEPFDLYVMWLPIRPGVLMKPTGLPGAT
jgi:integrase/recombinase XerD